MNVVAALAVGWFAAALVALCTGVRTLAWASVRDRCRHRVAARRIPVSGAGLRSLVGAVAAGAAAFVVVTTISGPVVAAVPAAMAAGLPARARRRRSAEHQRAVRAAWPTALRDVAMAVGAGRSLHQALAGLATSGPAPLRAVFDEYAVLSRTLGTPAALEHVRAVLDDAVADRVVEVLLVAAERGGATVRVVLDDLVAGISDELGVLETIETEALEGRINAQAVVVLPWLALVLVTGSDGPFRDFYRTPAGAVAVAIGALCSVGGAAAVDRLARVPDEPRVLRGVRS